MICDVAAIKWLGDNGVEASTSYQIGQQSAARFVFSLKWDKGKWKVTGKKFAGVS